MANTTAAALAVSLLQHSSYTYCYRWGAAGEQLTYVVVWAPTLLWSAFGGYAMATREIYYLLFWLMWWITAGLVYVLRQFSSWSQARPHPECTSEEFGGPNYGTSLLAHYLVSNLVHQAYTGSSASGAMGSWVLLLSVLVPVWQWYTGNASVTQLVEGALIGSGTGLVFMMLLIGFLLPRFPYLVGRVWHRVTGLRHQSTLVMQVSYAELPARTAPLLE